MTERFRTIWEKDPDTVEVIDQRKLPHDFVIRQLTSTDDVVYAIKEMVVRGAPLIGATASYGVYFAIRESLSQSNPAQYLADCFSKLAHSRPTAVNLFWALRTMQDALEMRGYNPGVALEAARTIVENDVEICRLIGVHGLALFEDIAREKGRVNVLTHCNAGMLACIEWGTISSPIYQAKQKGIDVHVWVDETRPRNQGANLTAWELTKHGIDHTLIVDNQGGHLMQHSQVDLVLVGTDRTTRQGDVANKIGTYLKALAARDNDVPFFVALPSTTIDWEVNHGLTEIPIEERDQDEVKYVWGTNDAGEYQRVLICPGTSKASNYSFDVTPARLVTGLITERGICPASEAGLLELFPEHQIGGK